MLFDADDDYDVAADDGDETMMMMVIMVMTKMVGESMLTGQNAFPGQVALQVGRNLIV